MCFNLKRKPHLGVLKQFSNLCLSLLQPYLINISSCNYSVDKCAILNEYQCDVSQGYIHFALCFFVEELSA